MRIGVTPMLVFAAYFRSVLLAACCWGRLYRPSQEAVEVGEVGGQSLEQAASDPTASLLAVHSMILRREFP